MNKDDARAYLIQTGEEGLVSWEEIARNCIAALSSEDCLWIMQVYDYEDFYESEDDEDGEYYEDGMYTMSDWRRDGMLGVDINQEISPDVYYQLLESVPPTTTGMYFQPGEAYTHSFDGVPLYHTFLKSRTTEDGDPIYIYQGLWPEK